MPRVAKRLGFRLLAELKRSPFASNAELGRHLGVTREAVRQRLDQFVDEGVLRGFSAIPAASIFGRQACDLVFATSVDLGLLARQPDVVYAINSIDGRCAVKGYVRDVSAFTRHMTEVVGQPAWSIMRGPEPGAPHPLSTIDLRVLRALVQMPRASFGELQDATGLAYRTVRASRERLVESGAITVQPILRRSRNGDLYHNLHLQGPACSDEKKVLGLLQDHLVLDRWHTPPSLYLFCHEENLDTHILIVDTLRRMPGIEQVEVILTKEYRLAEARVLGWIDELFAEWSQASGKRKIQRG